MRRPRHSRFFAGTAFEVSAGTRRGGALRLALGLLLCLAASGAHAADKEWNGSLSPDFENAGNWGGLAPLNDLTTDKAKFKAAATTMPVLTQNRQVAGIKIESSGWAIDFGSTHTLTLGIAGLEVRNAGTSSIAGRIAFGANQIFNIASGHTTTIGAELSGAYSLTISNSGTLILTGNNTYSGGTTISAGTLVVSSAGNLGAASGGLSIGAATLEVDGSFTTTRAFTLTNSAATIQVDPSRTFTINSVMSGSGGLIKTGTGTLVLGAANTFSGGVAVSEGVVRTQDSGALTSSKAVVSNGAALELQGNLSLSNAMDVNGTGIGGMGAIRSVSGTSSIAGAIALKTDANIGVDAGTLTLTGVVSGGGYDLTKVGAGTLVLAGSSDNTYSGITYVAEGTLLLNKTAGKNAFAGTLTIGDGIGTDVVLLGSSNQIPNVTVTLNSSGLLDFQNNSDAIGGMVFNGGSVVTGTGLLTLGGNITSNANASSATISGNMALGGDRTFSVADGAAADDLWISAVISGGNKITKTGTGTLTLSGSNTYTGNTAINAGQLIATSNNALGAVSGNTTVASGASLGFRDNVNYSSAQAVSLTGDGIGGAGSMENISGNNTFAGAITLANASTIGSTSGTLTLTGPINNNAKALTFTGAGNTAASGVISGSSTLTKTGTGVLTLTGNNTYAGLTTVSAGTLAVGSNNALGTSAGGTTVASGATLGFQGGINYSTAEAVTLNGVGSAGRSGALDNLSGTNTFAGNVTLGSASTIASTSGTLTLSGMITNGGNVATLGGAGNITANGAISGTGGLTKTGAGTVTLGAANTFTGVTTVSGGVLSLNADNALGSTTKVIINTGGTVLQGTSTAANNRVGNSTEIELSGGVYNTGGFSETAGKLTLTATSAINFGAGSSALTLAGASTLGSSILWITEWTGTIGATGGTDRLLFTGSGFVAGSVTNQVGFWIGGETYNGQFYDVGGGTLELAPYQLAVIPEPQTIFGGAFLLGLIGWRERRRLGALLQRGSTGSGDSSRR